ncbi:DUF3823 domain-containing protein [Daejeonella sp.]|uniref:DUF3823 domain-containing protein n=1 Tax=Daejeonella sp. TaxID=2805397 RepID=UPI003982DBDB
MKRTIVLNLTVGILFLCSCELDNYATPDIVLEGKVIDVSTGEAIQTRQPDGIKIRLIDEGIISPVPYDFWAQSDGTFRNTKIFAAKYKVSALQGPFEESSVTEVSLDLTKNQTITIKAEPFVRLTNVNITKSGNGIKATYKISPTTSPKKIQRSMLICYTSPILHENTNGKLSSATNILSGMTNGDIAAREFVDEIKNLQAGETYYARVAVLAANSLNRYNYSAIIKIIL